ncbi:MAG: molybdopterin biosynthesis protein MoeA [Actinomycetota bacterium]
MTTVLTPLNEVRESVLARCPEPSKVTLAREEARGLVLAEPVTAAEQVPPFANTAVDGYAVRAADTVAAPVTLRVVGEVAAGAVPTVPVTEHTAIKIMTGAPLPDGCDAIVMVEDTRTVGADGVEILKSASVGDAIREAGSDVPAGAQVFAAGTRITPMVEGVLATVNARTIAVWKQVRVGVFSTGDELVDDGSPLAPGQIRESNRAMLVRLVAEAGAVPIDLGIVRDDEDLLEAELRRAVEVENCDALLTSGGVSMGDYDVVKAVLGRIADMSWFQIAMKPAKPFAFGTLTASDGRTVPIFGLPGNPVSSLMSFELIARPALRTMMGSPDAHRPRVRAIVDEDVMRKSDGKVHFDRVRARWGDDGRVHVVRTGAQGSHQLSPTAAANAIMAVPDGDGVRAGDEVTVTFLGPDAGPVA